MSNMTLIRHGQANSSAQDEASYDKLSELGHQQARWLGAHLRQSGESYQRVYCGTMQRHQETAESMGAAAHCEIQTDARLNEFPYFSLAQAMQRQFNHPMPTNREGFAASIPKVLAAWEAGELENIPERHDAFSQRVRSVIDEIAAGQGPALVVSSGGLISTVLRHSLDLTVQGWAGMCLAIMNTSVHRWHRVLDRPLLTQFNAIPHLETPDRHYAQTHL
ncbi:histidine phosphatase family protein [Cognatishimia sp. WU-CL00825]|uniref:histidine phosphatase family protein n=1 Tax=Cognatishimia sp. WU-CL00825 TaxID=3127658 RepID=UPI003104D767